MMNKVHLSRGREGLPCLAMVAAAVATALLAPGPGGFAMAQTVVFPKPAPPPTPAIEAVPPTPEAQATVIVFNNKDPVSSDLAGYYARKRGIAFDHVVGLECSLNEEISREEYDRTIAEPLRKIFADRGWWRAPEKPETPVTVNGIRFLAVMRGVPLKIAPVAAYAGDEKFAGSSTLQRNEAAVDSELAILGVHTRKILGPISNPYYRSFLPFMKAPTFAAVMLVCRLDGPDRATVRRMIDDAVAAERQGLWGYAYVDSRGIAAGGLAEGDRWLEDAADGARKHGLPTVEDRGPEQFHSDYPMREAALYLGWYSESVNGPIARPNFRFNRGAIACHIHSSSAATLRNPAANWAAPLLARGAAATMGNVYEPYLTLTPNLDVFEERLRHGLTFAEAAYASMRTLSWMATIVGDPLYRPFPANRDFDFVPPTFAKEYAAYQEGARSWFALSRSAGEKRLAEAAKAMSSGIIWEGLGLLQWLAARDHAAAADSFEKAQKSFRNAEDDVRTIIHRAQMLNAQNKPEEAVAMARRGIKAFPKATATNVLRELAGETTPTPQASPPAAKPAAESPDATSAPVRPLPPLPTPGKASPGLRKAPPAASPTPPGKAATPRPVRA